MAKIPEYGVPEVLPEVFRGPKLPTQAPLEAFGGGQETARAFGSAAGVGQDVARFQEQERQKAYNDAVMMQVAEGVNQLSQETTRIKQGLMQVKGKDAQEAQGQVLGDLEKSYLAMDKTYKNEDVKNRLKEHYFQAQQNLDAWSQHYAHQQMEEYDAGEFQAGIKTAIASAAVDPSHGNTAEQSWLQKDAIRKYGERNGKGPEWIKENQDAVNSNIYFTALNALASSGADLHAKDFYEAHKNEMVGNDLIRAENIVKGSSRIGVAQKVGDQVFQKEQPTITAALTEAQKVSGNDWEDPETRRAVEGEIRQRYSEQRAAQKETIDNAFMAASKIVEETGDTFGIDRNTWFNVLTLSDRERLERRAADKNKLTAKKDNDDVISELYALTDAELGQKSEADMNKYKDDLSQKSWESWMAHWKKARTGVENLTLKTEKQDREELFRALQSKSYGGILAKDSLANIEKNEKRSAAFEDIWREAQARLTAQMGESKKQPTQAERKQIYGDLAIEKTATSQMEMKPWNYLTLSYPYIALSEAEKERMTQTVMRASGKEPSDNKLQLMKRAEVLGASPQELRRIALMDK